MYSPPCFTLHEKKPFITFTFFFQALGKYITQKFSVLVDNSIFYLFTNLITE